MLLRNKKMIPPGSSRGSTRSPVDCEDSDQVSPSLNLQASTDLNATVLLGKPAGCGEPSSFNSRLDNPQATAVSINTVHKGVVQLKQDVETQDIKLDFKDNGVFLGPCRRSKKFTL